MSLRHTIFAAALLTLPLAAQTQLVRGDVDGIQNTQGRFQLKCTNIEIVSTTVNLQALHDASRQQDIDYEMQVVPTTVGGRTVLNVVSAVQIFESLQMGNLRFGRNETWEVFGPAGADVWIFVSTPDVSSYLPLGAAGAWLIGNALPFHTAQIPATGRLQFRFTMPSIPALVGQEISSQAILRTNGAFSVTAPDCKDVRAN